MISEADIERLKAKAEAIAEQIKAEKAKQREEKRARAQQKAARTRELKKLERRSARSTCDVRVAKTRASERAKCAKKKTRPAPTKAKSRKSAARRIKPRPVAPGARAPEMLGEVVRPKALPDERSREARGRPMTVEARYDSENDWPIVTINNWAGPSGIAGDVRATWPPNAAEGVAVLRRESGEAEILKGADLHAAMSIALPKMALLVKKELVEEAGPRSIELSDRYDLMSGKKKRGSR